MTAQRNREERLFGIDRQQLLGGFILPALIALGVYFIKDFADKSANAQAAQDIRESIRADMHTRDREVDDIKARLLSVER